MIRRLLLLTTVFAAASCRAGDSSVSRFPSKPLTIVAPANPGGGWDQTARLIQQVWVAEKIVSVPVEVVNRPGAGGTIGLAELVTANRSDPHTIMVLGRVMLGAILTNHSAVSLSETVPLARLLDEYEVIAVAADSKYKTLPDLIEAFKKDPQSISWGGGSAGGTDHILAAMLARAAGVDPKKVNYIAHSGGGEASVAVMGSHVSAGISGYGEWLQHARSGRLRFLAVSSEERVGGDSTPTIRESGLVVTLANWRSLAAPPGITPSEKLELVSLLQKMRNSAAWQEILRKNYWQDTFLAGSEFEEFLVKETANNAAILEVMGLVPGTSFFPVVVGLGMLASGLWIVIVRRTTHAAATRPAWRGLVLPAGLLLAYILLFEWIGYVLATTALIFLTSRILHSRNWRSDLAASAAISTAVYVVFELILQKGLPRGWLPF